MAFKIIAQGTESKERPGSITINTGRYSARPGELEIIKPDRTVVFSPWVSMSGVKIQREFAGITLKEILYDNSHMTVTSTGFWRVEAELPPAPPAPPPVITAKENVVQFCSEEERVAAETLVAALKYELVKTCETPLPFAWKRIVVVGGQEANPAFRELGFKNIVEADRGFTYIQRSGEAWAVAGLERQDTIDAAKYVRDKGLPGATVRFRTVVETELQRAWREFAEKPDVVKAVGLLPSSTIESFSRVFSGYSYIDGKAAEPRIGDYVAVGAILAGLTLAAAAGVYALIAAIPGVGGAGMMKGMVGVSGSATTPGLTQLIRQLLVSPWWRFATGVSFVFMAFWNLTDPIWWQSAFAKISGDFKHRFETLRIDVSTKLKQAYNLTHISPTAATRAEALSLLRVTKPLVNDLFNLLSGPDINVEIREKYPEFENQTVAFIAQYNDLVKIAGGTADDYLVLGEMLVPIPAIAPVIPEDVVIENVKVYDGDTIEWPGHPEAQGRVRFSGMDAHEAGTTSGMAETEYLKSLIEGKTITIKVNTAEPLDTYGRLLGVPFLEGRNVVHMMLARFGSEILGTKYKHKFVDWDENKRIAAGAVPVEVPPGVVPVVPVKPVFKIRIESTPSNSKLYIDDVYTKHLTPSDEKELKDVMALLTPGKHRIRAERKGWAKEVEVDITEGDNGRIFLELEQVGLPAPAPPKVPSIAGLTKEQLLQLLSEIQKAIGVSP